MTLHDTLILGPTEFFLIMSQYPACQLTKLTDSAHMLQRYRLELFDIDEDCYFDFLVDNCIAMSSQLFYTRVKRDDSFARKMKARLAAEK